MDFRSPLRKPARRVASRRVATWSLLPLGTAAGFLGGRFLRPPRHLPLPPALQGEMGRLHIPFGELAYYKAGPSEGPPLLLIHSINAAANSYEVKPLFDHYAQERPVYALDLPGFGFSDRRDRIYTPRLMIDAIIAMVEDIRRRHGAFPIDVIALSVTSEFLARAATDHPIYFRSIGLVSPSGFESKRDREGEPSATFGMPAVRDVVSFPLWGRTLFDGLISKPSMRFFLEKTWGSKDIDEGLFRYDYASAHQPGAEYAPFSFISGFLFCRDALTVYKELGLPVWMTHGIRGDFVDFGRKKEVQGKPNWTIEVFRTGAMSHFERLHEVAASYDAFLARVA